jgi:hypothetical protein
MTYLLGCILGLCAAAPLLWVIRRQGREIAGLRFAGELQAKRIRELESLAAQYEHMIDGHKVNLADYLRAIEDDRAEIARLQARPPIRFAPMIRGLSVDTWQN